MKRLLYGIFCIGILSVSGDLFAWGNHTMLSHLIFDRDTASGETVKAETLQHFVETQKSEIAAMLKEDEAWLRTNITAYAPRPDVIAFTGKSSGETLRTEFLHAIRINPALPCSLFIQLPPGAEHTRPGLPFLAVATYEYKIPNGPFEKVKEGELLDSHDVIASAADEPDYGMDIGLYENNNTEIGKIYGFGEQSFGNPVYIYASQAPFHMAFYHESPIINLAASYIKRVNSEYRFHEFSSLSELAFKTGHPYWGYRFAGWALHYLQDESVLYHAVMLPGVTTFTMLKTAVLNKADEKARFLNEVSNKHSVYEGYEYDAISKLYGRGEFSNPMLAAFSDFSNDSKLPAFGERYVRDVVSARVADRKFETDAVVVKTFPARFISDVAFVYGTTEPESDLFALLSKTPEKQKALDAEMALVYRDLGSYSRKYIAWIKEGRPSRNTAHGFPLWVYGASAALLLLAAIFFIRRRK